MIQGASYGGYIALSSAIAYPDQIRGVISESGITDLSSFLAHTPGWRQTIQRTEFGDERDPKIKEFMDRTSPLKNVQRLKKPVLLFHGQNDPRVPVTEVTQLIAATKERIPVWYVLAKDEGHGFTQPANRDFRTYSTILFVQKYYSTNHKPQPQQYRGRTYLAAVKDSKLNVLINGFSRSIGK